MDLDIGARKPIDGDKVFVVGRYISSAEPPFVLLYDADKRRRGKRNIQKIDPIKIVAAIGNDLFKEVPYPGWGTVWFRVSRVRSVRNLKDEELVTSQAKCGALVLFEHDPEPEDEHAGFFLFGITAEQASQSLNAAPGGWHHA